MRDRAGHAPDDAGRLVLGDHGAAGRHDLGGAAWTILSHPREHEGENPDAPHGRCRGKQWIDRRPAEVDRRAVIQRDYGVAVAPRYPHVTPARGHIDATVANRLSIRRLGSRPSTHTREMLRKNGSK